MDPVAVMPAWHDLPHVLTAAAIVLLMTAVQSTALSGAVLASTGTALAGAIALHSVRRASFAGVSTVPLVGLLGIATLLAVAGPQPQAPHAHGPPSP